MVVVERASMCTVNGNRGGKLLYIEFISLIGGVIGVQKHPPLLFIVIN